MATGAVVWAARYLPFGGIDQVSVDTGVLEQNLRFPGQWFQAETGLHQNWMRDYDPTTGRYLQADPLGLVDGASVYGYARQGPVRWTDRRGLKTYQCTKPLDRLTAAVGSGLSRLGHDYLPLSRIPQMTADFPTPRSVIRYISQRVRNGGAGIWRRTRRVKRNPALCGSNSTAR